MRWPSARDLDEKSGYSGPAVYRIILKSKHGATVAISRFVGEDPQGILCIGETASMEKRRKDFKSGLERCRLHSEGKLLYLLKKYSRFRSTHKKARLQYQFKRLESKEDAERLEEKLLKQYVKKYAEVPPLNSDIPGRYNHAMWDC